MASHPTSAEYRRLLGFVHDLHTCVDFSGMSRLVLDEIVAGLGGEFGILGIMGADGRMLSASVSSGVGAGIFNYWELVNANILDHPIMAQLDQIDNHLSWHSLFEHVPQATFEETSLYRDAYRHMDIRFQGGTAFPLPGGGHFALGINRSSRGFPDKTHEMLGHLSPHFRQVLLRSLRLSPATGHLEESNIWLDHARSIVAILPRAAATLEEMFNVPIAHRLPRKLDQAVATRILPCEGDPPLSWMQRCPGGSGVISVRVEWYDKRLHQISIAPVCQELGGPARKPILTPREAEIRQLAMKGRSNKEIAHTLGISVRTVEKHMENLLGKLGLPGRWDLARSHGGNGARPG